MLITESELLRNIDVHAGNLIRGSGGRRYWTNWKRKCSLQLISTKTVYFGEITE